MAGNVWIVANIIGFQQSSVPVVAEGPTILEFIINYYVTSVDVTGKIQGQVIVTADMSLPEAQILKALKTAVAAAVDPLIVPEQSFTFNDVLGCNI